VKAHLNHPDFLRMPRYRTADVRLILNITPQQLRSIEKGIRPSCRRHWGPRSALHLFQLALAVEIAAYGVRVADASKIAAGLSARGDEAPNTDSASLATQLNALVSDLTLIIHRDDDGPHVCFVENHRLRNHIQSLKGAFIAIRLAPIAANLIGRIRWVTLGESSRALDAVENNDMPEVRR
jgi:hypothetical protein